MFQKRGGTKGHQGTKRVIRAVSLTSGLEVQAAQDGKMWRICVNTACHSRSERTPERIENKLPQRRKTKGKKSLCDLLIQVQVQAELRRSSCCTLRQRIVGISESCWNLLMIKRYGTKAFEEGKSRFQDACDCEGRSKAKRGFGPMECLWMLV